MNYTFSDRLKESLALAGNAASIEGMNVEPKHVLVGLLRTEESAALSVLDGLDVAPGEIIERVAPSLVDRDFRDPTSEGVGYTEEAKKAIHMALAEARLLESTYVGTEHLLLGLLRMEGTIARQALKSAGVRHEEARAETLNVWASGIDEGDEGENVWDRARLRVLRNLVEEGDETLEEFIRNIGAEERAEWARSSDGTWKTCDGLDWDEHGQALWKLFEEWSQRRQEAELQLAEAGLVDPRVSKLEKELRKMEAEGKEDTVEYAKLKVHLHYCRASLDAMGDGGGEDD